jgi:hypothetical protein
VKLVGEFAVATRELSADTDDMAVEGERTLVGKKPSMRIGVE